MQSQHIVKTHGEEKVEEEESVLDTLDTCLHAGASTTAQAAPRQPASTQAAAAATSAVGRQGASCLASHSLHCLALH